MTDAEEPTPEGDDLAAQIGREIGRARVARNLSVSELHRRTGISRTVLQGYEAGRYKPGARELRLLAETLDCSPNRLLFGDEEFRKRTHLDGLLGNADKVATGAKIGILFSHLTIEEQRAVLALVGLMVEARIGGREKLAEVLGVAEQMLRSLEADPDGAEARLQAFVPPELMQAIVAPANADTQNAATPGRGARRATAKGKDKPSR
jgi:transcriptional regulator with XRE-family HTH domain